MRIRSLLVLAALLALSVFLTGCDKATNAKASNVSSPPAPIDWLARVKAGECLEDVKSDALTQEIIDVAFARGFRGCDVDVFVKPGAEKYWKTDYIGPVFDMNGYAIATMPDQLWTDELVRQHIKQRPGIVHNLPKAFRTTANYNLALASGLDSLDGLPDEIINDKTVLLVAQRWEEDRKRNPDSTFFELGRFTLEYIDDDKITDAMVQAVMSRDPMSLQYVPLKKRTYAICKSALSRAQDMDEADQIYGEIPKEVLWSNGGAWMLYREKAEEDN